MGEVVIKQKAGDHLFHIIKDNVSIDRCDLLAAEEIAANLEEQQFAVKWVYPEDARIERKQNA